MRLKIDGKSQIKSIFTKKTKEKKSNLTFKDVKKLKKKKICKKYVKKKKSNLPTNPKNILGARPFKSSSEQLQFV